ncbi:hypothetical protein CPB84DRAFT_377413 [Gymnopilus junonius]|uniref:Uncharacterized protein n=1 Tax=Gymnopilus junonius TaxID=109634 RepID=A0A9P5NCV2_GYMJU|nr:hypothetical protein CPB84DRAFT_377413 [Gymnopilus junonius]
MLPRWRRRHTTDSVLEQTQNSNSTASFIGQKIHPDINSLAEELASSSLGQDKAFQLDRPESLELDIAGFVGLTPSTTRRIQREAYLEDNTSPLPNEHGPRESEGGHIGAYKNTIEEDQKETLDQSMPNTDPFHTADEGLLADEVAAHTATSSVLRRSTFGKRSRQRHFDPDDEAHSISSSSSNSNLSQSLVTCPSGFPPSDQPGTPGSQPRSLYTSTPRSRSNSSRDYPRGSDIPSPHTFGMITPPLQPNFKKNESYFTFKEAPPPLPPLDHPAFRNVPNAIGVSSSRHEFSTILGVDEHGRFTRHTHSLPSLTRAKSTTRIGSIKSTPKNTRPRSKSSVGTSISTNTIDQLYSEVTNTLKSRTHSRNQSKSSLASSRRSSAEYSAKQASLISDERVQDGGWEIQVSKEMIRLALAKMCKESKQSRLGRRETPIDPHSARHDAKTGGLEQHRGWALRFSCKVQVLPPSLII